MKKTPFVAAALMAMLFACGCATSYPVGGILTKVQLPGTVGDGAVPRAGLKRGVAECNSYLGMVAVGDASIYSAARNGGITKIHFVDWEADNVLGLIGTYRCTVYGE